MLNCLLCLLFLGVGDRPAVSSAEGSLWSYAKKRRDTLAVSTLFTAHQVRDHLATEKGRKEAVRWCKDLGITRVFVESFRGGYSAKRKDLTSARDYFRKAGLEVSGCVTTTRMGKQSTGWDIISCYTSEKTRKKLSSIFKYTAELFDVIMIDDFLFTDCACDACKKARGNKSWAQYRLDLMAEVSRRDILQAAREVNPEVEVIIKYPQWYDNFHNRGYGVLRQTEMFDWIWVGTETRDPDSKRWGRKAQYEAYFIMRWLSGIGKAKTGGGWFDPYGTSPATYCEQARQTVLAGAAEMMLFCYGALIRNSGAKNTKALKPEIRPLIKLAGWVQGRQPSGFPAVKPPSSQPDRDERYLFDWIGMLGFPLVPMHKLPGDAPALVATSHMRKATRWKTFLRKHLLAGKPVLASKAVVEEIQNMADSLQNGDQKPGTVVPLTWKGDIRSVMDIPQDRLNSMRRPLLKPFGITFEAPGRVALYFPASDVVAVENFAASPAEILLKHDKLSFRKAGRIILPPDAASSLKITKNTIKGTIPPRTLIALRLESAKLSSPPAGVEFKK